MKQKTNYHGFKKHQSQERLANLNRAWQYLTPFQKARILLLVFLHSLPDILQIIEHIQFHFNLWLTYRIYPAHWVRSYEQ